MAETQEDKTAHVKTLYQEPPFQAEKHQLLMAFGIVVPLLRPVSQGVPSLPATNPGVPATNPGGCCLQPATACWPMMFLVGRPIPNMGVHFSKDMDEAGPHHTT